MQQTKPTPVLSGGAPWFGRAAPIATEWTPVTGVRGRGAILACQPALAELARSTGQTGEADNLAYFLSTPDALKKIPHLLFLGRSDAAGPLGAVLLFEYRSGFGIGSRVFSTSDMTGRRDVLAPPATRAAVAALAARTLIRRGAHVVHIAFCETHLDSDTPAVTLPPPGAAEQAISAEFRNAAPRRAPAHWALDEREITAYLPLFSTFDETLARIGQKTRANLRYYRRRLEHECGCTFVPDVEITLADFLAFNRECTYAVPDELATFRYNNLSAFPNHRLRGVRDRNGRWLSLVGLRHQNHFADIDWQMNRAELPALSLATVMRSYLIEHEIALGSTRLYIEGGTPQPISRSFVKQRIGELTVCRDSTYVRLLERFGPLVFPPKNYIGQTLLNPHLHWRPW